MEGGGHTLQKALGPARQCGGLHMLCPLDTSRKEGDRLGGKVLLSAVRHPFLLTTSPPSYKFQSQRELKEPQKGGGFFPLILQSGQRYNHEENLTTYPPLFYYSQNQPFLSQRPGGPVGVWLSAVVSAPKPKVASCLQKKKAF